MMRFLEGLFPGLALFSAFTQWEHVLYTSIFSKKKEHAEGTLCAVYVLSISFISSFLVSNNK